jgi:hypothetical protein
MVSLKNTRLYLSAGHGVKSPGISPLILSGSIGEMLD